MGTTHHTLLVVDDNPVNREILIDQFSDAGFRVLGAENGREALLLIEREPIDIVLLDIMMPEISGLQILETLRQNPETQDLPVIMVTAKAESSDMVKALERGADDYVTKPVDFPVALARVRTLLRRSKNRASSSGEATPTGEPAPGAVLSGRYVLESQIGSGGFGVVFRAKHLELDRLVAVKLLRTNLTHGNAAARFRQEGIAACRIHHPNAVEVLDSGTTEAGVPFLVMELLEGRQLDDEMGATEVLSPERCVRIMAPVCRALAAAHDVNIVHRDIKPTNIFLHQGADGEVPKVLDFGIAKIVRGAAAEQQLTIEGELVGTPHFMAPERFWSSRLDGKSDVYAAAMVTYHALCGQSPFALGTTSPMAFAAMLKHTSPTSLQEHTTNLPVALTTAVMTALTKDPDARPTATEFAAQLEAAVGLEPMATTPHVSASADAEPAQSVRSSDEPPRDKSARETVVVRGSSRDRS